MQCTVKIVVVRGVATNYMSVSRAAEQHNLSRAWVKRLAQQDRIPGAFKLGTIWCIPTNWTPPTLQRGRPKIAAKAERAK